MDPANRIYLCRLVERVEMNKEYSDRLGITNKSYMRENKNNNKKKEIKRGKDNMINEMMEKLNKTTKKVSNEMQDVVDVSKLKAKIKKEEFLLDTDYINLGKLFYENYAKMQAENLVYKDVIESIDLRHLEIEKMEDQIRQLKGKNICPCCSAQLEETMRFCYKCGSPIVKESKETKEETNEATDGTEAQGNIDYNEFVDTTEDENK